MIEQLHTPNLLGLLDMHSRQKMKEINCCLVGTVDSYNPGKMCVTVKVNFKRNTPWVNADGSTTTKVAEYPVLTDVPLWVQSGGAAYITMPIKKGDQCILLFCDRDLEKWFLTGTKTSLPNTDRLHDFNDAIAIVGLFPQSSPIPSMSTTDIEVRGTAGAKVAVNEKVNISNPNMSLLTAVEALCDALVNAVDTRGDAFNGGTISAINAARDKFKEILK